MEIKLKKYDSYKDSGVEWIGVVPIHWGVDILNRIFKINTGNYFLLRKYNCHIYYFDM